MDSDRTIDRAEPLDEYPEPDNFIEAEVVADLQARRFSRVLCTRFPPEPNGYWHIGHVYALNISSTVARKYGGVMNLRFDDTNPAAEEQEFVDAGMEDLEWLGAPVTGKVVFASDFFEQLYEIAVELIRRGHAFVCDLSLDEMREGRGDYYTPGKPSPYRRRSIEESLDLFRRMRAGEFAPREKTLRAIGDMSAPNMNLRDPILYRIMDEPHYRQGTTWRIYPSYDFAQSFNDALDGVTHSLCSSEFISHRPLYDWLLEKAGFEQPPRQIEFAKVGITGAILGKRNIRPLVEQGVLSGWDDPRLYTVRGMRRRGFPAAAIFDFCRRVGVSRSDTVVDSAMLEHCVRELLNKTATRRMAVLRPVRLVLENIAPGTSLPAKLENNPEDPSAGTRELRLTRELFIDADDFMVDPPRKYFRLAPDREVRLRGAPVIKCTGFSTDPATRAVTEIRATCDLDTLGRAPTDGRKVRGVIHWVSQEEGVDVEIRLYDRLLDENEQVDPTSRSVVEAIAEPSVQDLAVEERIQFERVGYFCVDPDSRPGRMVFNRTVTLKDRWKAILTRGNESGD